MPDNSQKIRRAKQIQAPLSYGSGALGVGGLAALATKGKSRTANKIYAPLTTASVGVGSVGSFNFARLQGLEAKHKPRQQPKNVYYVRNKRQIDALKAKSQVSKAQRKKRDYSGALIGTGTTAAAGGLVGGGIPIARPDSGRLSQALGGKHTKTEKTRHLVSATRGGVFGYREDAHRRYLNNQNSRLKDWKPHNRGNAFERGRELGRTIPERQIIRHMKNARTGSNIAMGAGTAMVGGGLYLRRKKNRQTVKKRNDDHKFRSDMMISGGLTTAGASGLGSLALDRQGKKWSQRSAEHVGRAKKMNPKLGGYDVIETKRGGVRNIRRSRNRVPDVQPHRNTGDIIWNHKKTLGGRSYKKSSKMGQLRGMASQERYFASTYGNNARVIRRLGISGGLGLAGAGLVHRNYKLEKRPSTVRKDLGGVMDFGLSSVRQGENVEISKRSYNPEDRRYRRSERVIGAQPYLSGALGVGAGAAGYDSYRKGKSALKHAKNVSSSGMAARNSSKKAGDVPEHLKKLKSMNISQQNEALRSQYAGWKKAAESADSAGRSAFKARKAGQASLKSGGAAAGLGALAIGAKLGSDRIKGYYEKKGRTYRPLHRNVH